MGANANVLAGAASCACASTSEKSISEAQHSGDKVYSFALAPAQLAAHGYSARTLAFTLALRFLKRDFLSLMCHIRCGTFTWVALQV